MKRIYISIVFFILALSVAAVEMGFVSGKADSFISMIQQSDRYMRRSNFNEAITVCEMIEQEWSESAESIDMLLIHDYVDAIGNSIAKMRTFAENRSAEMYFAESASAKKELASIKESEYPNWENIL